MLRPLCFGALTIGALAMLRVALAESPQGKPPAMTDAQAEQQADAAGERHEMILCDSHESFSREGAMRAVGNCPWIRRGLGWLIIPPFRPPLAGLREMERGHSL